jgi:flagellar motor switch protein FliN/FliY
MINKVSGILEEAVKSVMPMLLPKPMEISLGEIKDWQPQAFPSPMVLITTNFSEGPAGAVYMLVATSNASMMVDIMLGGDGAEDRAMNEEAVDAIKELINQVFGVLASGIRDNVDIACSFEQVEVHSLEAEMDLGLLLDDDETKMIDVNFDVEGLGNFPLMVCFPQGSLTSLENESSGAGGGAADELGDLGDIQMPSGIEMEMQPPIGPPIGEDAPGDFAPAPAAGAPAAAPTNIDLIMEIELPVVIRLGSTELSLKEVMKLGPGAIIELNKGVDEAVELLVNNQIIAQGEVVVVEGNFAFRVTEIESKSKRITTLS